MALLMINPAIPANSPAIRQRRGVAGVYVDADYVGKSRTRAVGDGAFIAVTDVFEVTDATMLATLQEMTVENGARGLLDVFVVVTGRATTIDAEGIIRGTVTQTRN